MGMAATRSICGHMVDEEDALNDEGELFRYFSDKKIAAFVGNLVEIDAWGFVAEVYGMMVWARRLALLLSASMSLPTSS